MHQVAEFEYAEVENCQVVGLPYVQGLVFS